MLKAGGQAIETSLVQKCVATAKRQAKTIQKLMEKANKVSNLSGMDQSWTFSDNNFVKTFFIFVTK